MDPDSSSLVSKVVNEIRSVFGFEEAITEFIVEIGRSNEATVEEFSLRSKEFLPRIPLKYILTIFDTIRENFPPKPPETIVKVLSISDKNSPTLSLKPVDQKTGKDLETKDSERDSFDSEKVQIGINRTLANILRRKNEKSGSEISPAINEKIPKIDFELYCLGAINAKGKTTDLGSKMAKFVVGPDLSRILMAGVDFWCGHEVLTIVAMIGTGCTFFQIADEEERRAEAARNRVGFFQPDGDHLTLLAVFEAWEENGVSAKWCLDNFVFFESLKRAKELRNKLVDTMNRLGLEIMSAEKDHAMIRKAITAGLFSQAARWDPEVNCYRTLIDSNRTVHIHPRCALFREERPRFVVHSGFLVGDDNKEYMIWVTAIDPKWLVQVCPLLFKERVPRGLRR